MIEMVNFMLWAFYYNKNIYYGGLKAVGNVGWALEGYIYKELLDTSLSSL